MPRFYTLIHKIISKKKRGKPCDVMSSTWSPLYTGKLSNGSNLMSFDRLVLGIPDLCKHVKLVNNNTMDGAKFQTVGDSWLRTRKHGRIFKIALSQCPWL